MVSPHGVSWKASSSAESEGGDLLPAFLPQFIGPTDPVVPKSLLLAGIHYIEGILWLVVVSIVVDQTRRFFLHATVRRWLGWGVWDAAGRARGPSRARTSVVRRSQEEHNHKQRGST